MPVSQSEGLAYLFTPPTARVNLGTRVYVRSSPTSPEWLPGMVVTCTQTASGNPPSVTIRIENSNKLVAVNKPGHIYIQDTSRSLSAHLCNDLSLLRYIHEPAIVQVLQDRYLNHSTIYSYAGPTLLAVNPYRDVANLYSLEMMEYYQFKTRKYDSAPPHVFMVGEEAYQKMMDEDRNQAIVIIGESGAGKTETTKLVMQYLVTSASLRTRGRARSDSSRRSMRRSGVMMLPNVRGPASDVTYQPTELENRILQSNVILEAFGNAMTIHNDNSSRFAKFVELRFDFHGKVVGALLTTFLLERSRVTEQPPQERSFHVFHQMCAGADDDMRDSLRVGYARDYAYLGHRDGGEKTASDAASFAKLQDTMKLFGMDEHMQAAVFRTLSGILHLGNISFKQDGKECAYPENDRSVETASALLGVRLDSLVKALCTRDIHAHGETVVSPLTAARAAASRDALARGIYEKLFDWVVRKINVELDMNGEHGEGVEAEADLRSIGIVDIFGFEVTPTNSFEQLLINYANEKLQFIFSESIIEENRRSLREEGLDTDIDIFPDGSGRVQLFEKKPAGILCLLDEESGFPGATDGSFITKLQNHIGGNKYIRFARAGGDRFQVRHFAGDVNYDADGMLRKNRDHLRDELFSLASSSRMPMLRALFEKPSSSAPESPRSRRRTLTGGKSVCYKFMSSLSGLMQRLQGEDTHYIKCIRPNKNQEPGVFDNDLVLKQVQHAGIEMSLNALRQGYPVRMTHEEFLRLWGHTMPQATNPNHPRARCLEILSQMPFQEGRHWQVGSNLVFLNSDMNSTLEEMGQARTERLITGVQRLWRRYRRAKASDQAEIYATKIQKIVRGHQSRAASEARLAEARARRERSRLERELQAWNIACMEREDVLSDLLRKRRKAEEEEAERRCREEEIRRLAEKRRRERELMARRMKEMEREDELSRRYGEWIRLQALRKKRDAMLAAERERRLMAEEDALSHAMRQWEIRETNDKQRLKASVMKIELRRRRRCADVARQCAQAALLRRSRIERAMFAERVQMEIEDRRAWARISRPAYQSRMVGSASRIHDSGSPAARKTGLPRVIQRIISNANSQMQEVPSPVRAYVQDTDEEESYDDLLGPIAAPQKKEERAHGTSRQDPTLLFESNTAAIPGSRAARMQNVLKNAWSLKGRRKSSDVKGEDAESGGDQLGEAAETLKKNVRRITRLQHVPSKVAKAAQECGGRMSKWTQRDGPIQKAGKKSPQGTRSVGKSAIRVSDEVTASPTKVMTLSELSLSPRIPKSSDGPPRHALPTPPADDDDEEEEDRFVMDRVEWTSVRAFEWEQQELFRRKAYEEWRDNQVGAELRAMARNGHGHCGPQRSPPWRT